jgi:starch-binding outer membrane protein, SusD/RagB family
MLKNCKMKKIIYIIAIAALMICNSCTEEILNKEPLDIISDAVVWNDKSLMEALLAEQYNGTPVMVNDAVATAEENLGLSKQTDGCLDLNEISGEARAGWQYYTNVAPFKASGISSDGGFSEYWEKPYKTIRNLNEFIEKTPNSGLDPQWIKLRVAEARFLRAFNYFAMVKRYGGVPLILKAQQPNDPENELYPKRNSEKEVYDFIIKEMDEISEPLLGTTEYGRPTKWAALSLKGRAALYAGSIAQFGKVQLNGLLGFTQSESAAYYQKVYDATNSIIKSGKFALYNVEADKVMNFRNLFVKKRHSEGIFAVQHNNIPQNAGGNGWAYDFCNCPKPQAWAAGLCNAPYLETAEAFEYIDGSKGTLDRVAIQQGLWTMKELWKNKDPRFFATLWTQGTPWKGDTVRMNFGLIDPNGKLLENAADGYGGIPAFGYNNWYGLFYTSIGVMKYLDENTDNNIYNNSSTDYLVFRYGETLLNFAEAAFELGKANEALDAINQIRDRAGIARLTTITRENIRQERRVELAFEAHRYWDLRRWRIATTELTRSNSGIRYILDYNTRKFKLVVLNDIDGANTASTFPEKNYYFPITKGRIANNKNLVENPGYTN